MNIITLYARFGNEELLVIIAGVMNSSTYTASFAIIFQALLRHGSAISSIQSSSLSSEHTILTFNRFFICLANRESVH